MDILELAQQFGLPVALLVIAVGVTWRLYLKALSDNATANQKALADRDERIDDLEEENKQLQAKVYRLLDRGEQLAELADAPKPPPGAIRRRRSEV